MKVFFIGTPRGNLEKARAIYEEISKMGLVHTTDFMVQVNPEKFYQADEKMWSNRYRKRLKEIAAADICVFEVSQHSLAVGQLVQEAIRREKPVILLHEEGKKPYFFRGTEGSELRVQMFSYSEETIREVLEYGVGTAKELLMTRFTMLLPPEMVRFLDSINDKKGISRSEYIRGLIRREMKKRI